MKWILGIAIGWLALGFIVARWVGVASGPKSPEERSRDDAEQARALGLDRKPADTIETADLVEAALEDFYGDPFPGSGPQHERRPLGHLGGLSPTRRRCG